CQVSVSLAPQLRRRDNLLSILFFSLLCPPPISTLFPYTTLFRSNVALICGVRGQVVSDRFHIYVMAIFQQLTGARSTVEISPLRDRKSTRLNSSHDQISYGVFCLKKKNKILLVNDSASRCALPIK